jgi:tetratricopeptide (TPR) repeat protein
MRSSVVWFSLAGVAVGFLLGFFVANTINRSEINELRAQADPARQVGTGNSNNQSEGELTDAEIRAKIAEADANPTNTAYQKNLGLALYRYGVIKNDVGLITEAARLLERAHDLSPHDRAIDVGLGAAWFDIGYINKDSEAFKKARKVYERVLVDQPKDADVITDIGMTYYLSDPSDDRKATEAFKRAIAIDPKNEKALEFIVQSLARQNDITGAKKYLTDLRAAYPTNASLAELTARVDPDVKQNPQ